MRLPTPHTLPDGTILRNARPGDAEPLTDMILGLAEHLGHRDEVKSSAEQLHEVLFGSDSVVRAFVLEREGRPVGTAIWYRTYSTWEGVYGIFLEDLFVDPSCRGRGYGTVLLSALAETVRINDYARLEWQVVESNTGAIRLYNAIGGVDQEEIHHYRLAGDRLDALAARLGETA